MYGCCTYFPGVCGRVYFKAVQCTSGCTYEHYCSASCAVRDTCSIRYGVLHSHCINSLRRFFNVNVYFFSLAPFWDCYSANHFGLWGTVFPSSPFVSYLFLPLNQKGGVGEVFAGMVRAVPAIIPIISKSVFCFLLFLPENPPATSSSQTCLSETFTTWVI